MADWYCDYATGDDSTGDGSSGTPYKTLQKCIDSAARGDNIWIANTSAQVLSSALTWNTGYNTTGSSETIIRGWDNGGSIVINRPGVGNIPAGKIDASGLATDWGNGSTAPLNVMLYNLIIDNSNTANSLNARSAWNFVQCEFISTTKTSGYSILSPRGVYGCYFDQFGLRDSRQIVYGSVFDNNAAYAIFEGVGATINCTFITSAISTTSNPVVHLNSAYILFIQNCIISRANRTGPLLFFNTIGVSINNVLQGSSGVGGSGINYNSLFNISAGNVFYNNTTNTVNGTAVVPVTSDVTGAAALLTDVGTNEYEASSELQDAGFPKGFLSTDTLTRLGSGPISFVSAGGGVRQVNIRGGADQ